MKMRLILERSVSAPETTQPNSNHRLKQTNKNVITGGLRLDWVLVQGNLSIALAPHPGVISPSVWSGNTGWHTGPRIILSFVFVLGVLQCCYNCFSKR